MSESIKDGGPAFPQPNHIVDTDRGREEARGWMADSGMSLRDWFAGQALAGMAASPYWCENLQANRNELLEPVAKTAYAIADAMLKAREGVK